jgi:hypothetical protein
MGQHGKFIYGNEYKIKGRASRYEMITGIDCKWQIRCTAGETVLSFTQELFGSGMRLNVESLQKTKKSFASCGEVTFSYSEDLGLF